MGDLASYDAFTLGGPYSVHGYNMGELGAAQLPGGKMLESNKGILNFHHRHLHTGF
jgi:outer membrane protein assembly factor BamA